MTDLRKAAEDLLEGVEAAIKAGDWKVDGACDPDSAIVRLRQALAQPDEVLVEREACARLVEADGLARGDEGLVFIKAAGRIRARSEKPLVKSYCGGKPNYCTPEATPDVDAVNISAERVDETAKGEHEPFIYVREDNERPFGGYEHCSEADAGAFPVYTAPPNREWVGLTQYQKLKFAERFRLSLAAIEAIEAKLKEKNT